MQERKNKYFMVSYTYTYTFTTGLQLFTTT